MIEKHLREAGFMQNKKRNEMSKKALIAVKVEIAS